MAGVLKYSPFVKLSQWNGLTETIYTTDLSVVMGEVTASLCNYVLGQKGCDDQAKTLTDVLFDGFAAGY